MKHNIRILAFAIAALISLAQASAQSVENSKSAIEDRYQELVAERWIESFSRLDGRNNIVMVLVGYDKLYELKGVTALTQDRRILVVKYRGPDAKEYKALVYPSSILIIKESPKDQ